MRRSAASERCSTVPCSATGSRRETTLTRIIDQPGPVKSRLRAALILIVEANAADLDRRGCLAVNTAAELAGADPKATRDVRQMFERNRDDPVRDSRRAGRPQRCSGRLRGGVLTQVADETGDVLGH